MDGQGIEKKVGRENRRNNETRIITALMGSACKLSCASYIVLILN